MLQAVLRARRCRAAFLAIAVVTSGCGSLPDPTLTSPTSVTEVFSGTLAPNGSKFYSFTMNTTGTVGLVLSSVQKAGVDSGELLWVGFGAPRATDCSVSSSVQVAADPATTILPSTQVNNTWCVRVWDDGTISGTTTFSVNITYQRQ